MVGVHVGELAVDEEADLVLAPLLLLPDVGGHDALGLLTEARVAIHLNEGWKRFMTSYVDRNTDSDRLKQTS